MAKPPWNGRGKPPGYKSSRPTVHPHSIDAVFARITCPKCGQTHAYSGNQLGPLPVEAGDTRAVICLRHQAAIQLERIGHRSAWKHEFYGIPAFPFYIHFDSKETP